MNVLITDPALESLALYNGLSTENSRQIEKILSGLRNAQLPCRILRLSGLSRPIWHHHVDSEYSLYFAIGSGSSGPELRIFFFGITIQEDSNLYKHLVYLSGELEGPSIPDHMELLEQAQVVNWPRHPKYKLDIEDRLDDYLCKSDSATETDQARFPAPADDLNGRSFRLFTSIRSPIDLPARLSSKQREVLGKARPLLIQGIAGSGKTTLLAHFAQQESSRSEGTASILIVAYTDELKGFIVRTLHALADASPFPTIGIDVYTWREICAFIANKVGIKAIQLIAARYSLKNRTEWRADAIGFENQGAYLAAGECWERAGEYLAAARAYELGGHMDNALKNYLALDDIDNSGRLLRALGRNREAAQLFETAARFGEAGECWAVAGNHEKAAKAYQIGGEACKDTSLWGKAGLCWTKARRSDLAAAAFVKAEQWRDAATQFRDYGDLLQAAIYFSRSGDKLQAAEFYARYYESRGDCAQAAQHWELAREDSRAADCYRMAGELTHALELLRRCHRFEDAAEISEELHDHLNAGQCWAECGNHEKAAQAYEVVAETKNEVAIWSLVAQHYAKAGRFKFSAHAYAKAGRWQDAAVQYRDCSDFLHAAEYFEKAHCWEDASTSWLKLYHPMGIHPHEQLLVGWLRRTSSAPMSENYDMRLVAMLAKVLAGHTSPDNSRTLQLADDTLRKFRAIGDLDIPPFTILCRTVSDLPGLTSNELGVLNASTSMSAAVLQECNNELHRRIAEFQQSLPHSNFTSTSARENEAVIQCAQVLEICHELTDAYNLYLRAGDKESSARCLERLDRVREAADLYMEIGRKEDAAYCYERARDYLRSAYLWIELKRYSVAAKTLNLAGENSLAILSGAMFFFDRGDASRAHQMLSGMTLKGKKLSPDTCLKELLALKTRAFPRPPSPPPQSSSSRIMFGLRSMAAKLLQVIRRVRQVERG